MTDNSDNLAKVGAFEMKIDENRPALAVGTEIGVYEIQELIASDRVSLSYRAWNHHMNGPVLVREYFPSDLAIRGAKGRRVEAKSESDQERYADGLSEFLYDGEKLSDIEHEAIARILTSLEFNNTGYQIISYDAGENLASWLESTYTFTQERLRIIFESLLDGTKTLHERGMIHGMICPENILLRQNGIPVLVNFPDGLLNFAKEDGKLAEVLPAAYAPSEQYQADHPLVPADDLYALGATLYHCILKRAPTPALERQKLLAKGQKDPMSGWLHTTEDQSPEPWLQAIDWMLQPAFEKRPHQVSQIESFLAERGAPSTHVKTPADNEKPDTPPSDSRSPAGLWKFALVIVLLAVGGIFLYTEFGPKSVETAAPPELVQETDNSTAVPTAPSQAPLSQIEIPEIEEEILLEISPAATEAESEVPEGIPEVAEQTVDIVESSDTAPSSSEAEPPELEAVQEPIEETAPVLAQIEPAPKTQEDQAQPEPQPISEKTLEQTRQAELIAQHLKAAKANLAKFDLTTPTEDNAFLNYQTVLSLDPENEAAQVGMQEIVNRYVGLIELALRLGKIHNASVYLERAQSIDADSPILDSLRAQLERGQDEPPESPN